MADRTIYRLTEENDDGKLVKIVGSHLTIITNDRNRWLIAV